MTDEEPARLIQQMNEASTKVSRSKLIALGTEFKERKLERLLNAGLGAEEEARQAMRIESPLENIHERALLALRVLAPRTELLGVACGGAVLQGPELHLGP